MISPHRCNGRANLAFQQGTLLFSSPQHILLSPRTHILVHKHILSPLEGTVLVVHVSTPAISFSLSHKVVWCRYTYAILHQHTQELQMSPCWVSQPESELNPRSATLAAPELTTNRHRQYRDCSLVGLKWLLSIDGFYTTAVTLIATNPTNTLTSLTV